MVSILPANTIFPINCSDSVAFRCVSLYSLWHCRSSGHEISCVSTSISISQWCFGWINFYRCVDTRTCVHEGIIHTLFFSVTEHIAEREHTGLVFPFSWETPFDVCLVKEHVGKMSSLYPLECLLKNTFYKHSKFFVNQRLDHFEIIVR